MRRYVTLRNARRLAQVVFLLLFLWLFFQTESKGDNTLGVPVKVFLDADPLLFLTTILANRSLVHVSLLALVTVAATMALGRVFCGWICPLGTLHHLVSALRRRRAGKVPPEWRRAKYLLLLFGMAGSLLSFQAAGVFDPLSLLIRSLSLSIHPAFQYAATSVFDGIGSLQIHSLDWAAEALHGFFAQHVFSFRQPLFRQAIPLGIVFAALLALNLVERRFWCKYLCPLGALLGILSRWSLIRREVSEACNGCGACADACPGCALPDRKSAWRREECFACLDCDDLCPRNAVSFGFSRHRKGTALDLGKRRVLAALAAGAAFVPLARVTPLARAEAADPLLIRPPGARDEPEFLRRCVKCGECMKVCLTGGLQPALGEAGLEGIWSPVLVPRIGYCEYRCTLCGQVCPTGAIASLSLAQKAGVRIGTAMIDPGRCLPYAHGRSCLVCEEVCPTPKKAIWFDETWTADRNGAGERVKRPRVDLELCVGCGVCEAKCPVLGDPAIRVTSIGESRSRTRQLLL